jgi:hypothetical protein
MKVNRSVVLVLLAMSGLATASVRAQPIPFLINSFNATVTNFDAPGLPFTATDTLGVLGPVGGQLLITDLTVQLWNGSGIPGANTGTFDASVGQFDVLWAATAEFNLRNPATQAIVGTGTGRGAMSESGTLTPLPSGAFTGNLESTAPANMNLVVRDGDGEEVLQEPIIVINIKTVTVEVQPAAATISGTLQDRPGQPSLFFELPSSLGGNTLRGALAGSFAASLSGACYGNCDGSTVQPVLTPNDFQCFLNAFAAGQSYANCDASTMAPVLTANDFLCFVNAYAAGCP